MNSAENVNICISNWKPWGKLAQRSSHKAFPCWLYSCRLDLNNPEWKDTSACFCPRAGRFTWMGVSLGSRTLKLQRLQFQQPWVKKQSSHVCSQNTEWEIWAADKRNTFLCHFEIPRREGFCDKVYRQCVRIPVHLWVCQPRCLHGSVMTMLGEG